MCGLPDFQESINVELLMLEQLLVDASGHEPDCRPPFGVPVAGSGY